MDSDKFIELPSGANCELFKPMQTKRCRVENDLDTNRNYIGFTGTLLGHQGDIKWEQHPDGLRVWFPPKKPKCCDFLLKNTEA